MLRRMAIQSAVDELRRWIRLVP